MLPSAIISDQNVSVGKQTRKNGPARSRLEDQSL